MDYWISKLSLFSVHFCCKWAKTMRAKRGYIWCILTKNIFLVKHNFTTFFWNTKSSELKGSGKISSVSKKACFRTIVSSYQFMNQEKKLGRLNIPASSVSFNASSFWVTLAFKASSGMHFRAASLSENFSYSRQRSRSDNIFPTISLSPLDFAITSAGREDWLPDGMTWENVSDRQADGDELKKITRAFWNHLFVFCEDLSLLGQQLAQQIAIDFEIVSNLTLFARKLTKMETTKLL